MHLKEYNAADSSDWQNMVQDWSGNGALTYMYGACKAMGGHLCKGSAGAVQDGRGQLLKLLASDAAAEVNVVHEALHV